MGSPATANRRVSEVEWIGNPKLALARWRSLEFPVDPPELAREFAWVDRVFKGLERLIATYLICLLDDAPCGVTEDIAKAVATDVFEAEARSAVRIAVTRVQHYLRRAGMLEDAIWTGGFLRKLGISSNAHSSILGDVHPSLATYVRRTAIPSDLAAISQRTTNALKLRRDRCASIDIILALRERDLVPFYQSTFRDGLWGTLSIAEWLRRRERFETPSSNEAYLERFAHATYQLYRRTATDPVFKAETQLGPPPETFVLGDHLYKTLCIASRSVEFADANFDKFLIEVSTAADANVAAESLCWVFDLCRLRTRLSSTKLHQFLALFTRAVRQDVNYTVVTRLMIYRRLIACMRHMGRDFVIQNESTLMTTLAKYFEIAIDADNTWHLSEMTKAYLRLRGGISSTRQLRRALSVLADDGNPNLAD